MPNWRGADIPRFFRAPDQDAWFPAHRLVSSLIETLRGLGIEASQHRGVTLGIERRPRKSPRAFCAPVRVPGEIYLVPAPVGADLPGRRRSRLLQRPAR
jgi:hypothetical protein